MRAPRATLAPLVLLALPLGACTSLPDVLGPLETRVVAAKEAPSTLVADDGGRCTVSASKFADVKVGQLYTCAWSDAGP